MRRLSFRGTSPGNPLGRFHRSRFARSPFVCLWLHGVDSTRISTRWRAEGVFALHEPHFQVSVLSSNDARSKSHVTSYAPPYQRSVPSASVFRQLSFLDAVPRLSGTLYLHEEVFFDVLINVNMFTLSWNLVMKHECDQIRS
jgi:hypothetical protein